MNVCCSDSDITQLTQQRHKLEQNGRNKSIVPYKVDSDERGTRKNPDCSWSFGLNIHVFGRFAP